MFGYRYGLINGQLGLFHPYKWSYFTLLIPSWELSQYPISAGTFESIIILSRLVGYGFVPWKVYVWIGVVIDANISANSATNM